MADPDDPVPNAALRWLEQQPPLKVRVPARTAEADTARTVWVPTNAPTPKPGHACAARAHQRGKPKSWPQCTQAPKPKRRIFSAEYELRIVAEYDAAPAGEKGAILRRERLYSSHVIEWRQARDAGALTALTDRRTTPARPKRHPAEAEAAKLRAENERLRREVARKDAALEVLGKTHALLEQLSGSAD